ncbi:MAG: carbohydrate-binding protein CenC, partial [Arenimonas sp.]
GTMGNTTDKDFFALGLAANETVKVVMSGGPSTSDYDLYLVNASDGTIVSSTSGTNAETLTWKNGATAQTVYAKVIAYSGSSTTLAYTLTLTYTPGTTVTERVTNGGFESGATGWTATSGVIDNSTSQAARTGSYKAWLNGYGSAHTDSLLQSVSIPSTATSASFTFWLKVVSAETTTTTAYDTLKVQVRNTSGTVLATLATYSNLDKGSSYVQRSFDLSAYKGQTVQLYFLGTEGSTVATSFLVDDVSVK